MRYIVLLLFLNVILITSSQAVEEGLLEKGIRLQNNSQYREARVYLEKAKDFYQGQDVEKYLLCKSLLGYNLLKTNNWEEGVKFLQENITEANTLSARQDFWKSQNEYYIADAQFNLGKYDLAKSIVVKNIETLKNTEYRPLLAKHYNLLGIILWEEGNNNQALEYIEESILINQLDSTSDLGSTYNDLGLIYQGFDPIKSAEYYEKALRGYRKIYPDIHAKNAVLYSNMGLLDFDNGNYFGAQSNFEKSKEIWEAIYPYENHPSEAYLLNNIGRVYLAQKSYELASQYFENALKMYEENYNQNHPEIANTLNLMADAQISAGEFKPALNNLQKALINNSDNFISYNSGENPSALDFISSKTFLSSLLLKSKALRQQYITNSLRLKDLKFALMSLEVADSVLDKSRNTATSQKDKILYGLTSSKVYQEAVDICYLLANETQQLKKYYKKAFYFSEKAKAIVLLGSINESNARNFGNIPEKLLEKEKELRQDISFLERQIALKVDTDLVNSYKSRLFTLNRDYENLQAQLEKEFRDYYDLKYNVKPVSVDELQETLDDNTLMLDYMITDNQIYIFKIDAKDIDLVVMEKDERFDANIIYILNAIRYRVKSAYLKMGHQLYKAIFPKRIKKSIKHIVVVQDGKLTTLPVETLLDSKIKSKDIAYSEVPFLLKKWNFSYAYSATIWHQNINRTDQYNNTAALIAPVEFKGINRLPATEEEVNNIASVSRNNSLQVNMLLREQASEESIKKGQFGNYSILHFATHGQVDEENPELSRIILRQSDLEDGNLFASEVYNLDLKADLVTLSACEVGLGKFSSGEGVIGLGRAFLYAGAENLVLSLWRVTDKSTAQLMTNFYKNKFLNDERGYAGALRQAKLKLLQQQEFSAPYYWAAFLVLGE